MQQILGLSLLKNVIKIKAASVMNRSFIAVGVLYRSIIASTIQCSVGGQQPIKHQRCTGIHRQAYVIVYATLYGSVNKRKVHLSVLEL